MSFESPGVLLNLTKENAPANENALAMLLPTNIIITVTTAGRIIIVIERLPE